jgi:transposase
VLHVTPPSASWLNFIEHWFAELTTNKLRRGTHTSVRRLNNDILAWIASSRRWDRRRQQFRSKLWPQGSQT